MKHKQILTKAQEYKIISALLVGAYNFKEHTPLGIDLDPYEYVFLDSDGNEFYFDGGTVTLDVLFRELRDELEAHSYDVSNFEHDWINTMIKLELEEVREYK